MKLLKNQAINELEKALLTRCRDAIKGVDPSAGGGAIWSKKGCMKKL